MMQASVQLHAPASLPSGKYSGHHKIITYLKELASHGINLLDNIPTVDVWKDNIKMGVQEVGGGRGLHEVGSG
jgi:hypothetical protein